jgi:hypothetical protein
MGPNDRLRRTAEALVAGCREGRERENLGKLYAEDAVSVEAFDMPSGGREAHGLGAIRAKHDWWEGANEELESGAEGPFCHGEDRFTVIFSARIKDRQTGEVTDMRETGTYTVSPEGRIVREEFFWAM